MSKTRTQLEALKHTPNPLALACSLRGGKGAHKTTKGNNRADRRAERQRNKKLED